ncbi:HAD hydrolase-like protein [Acrocarpospora sp. B8E8]|uniref:HAD hydrolase-like protein n=1 Tax=Acrocarpospora sp. B8E8 TaxID=3153572 RepID=UPI00325FD7EC
MPAGGVDLLTGLVDKGYLVGLITGNLESAAHIKLHRANLNRFFSFGGYGSDSNDRAEVTRIALRRASLVYGEELDLDCCLVIGDTPHDVAGAHAAGVACVGVASHNFNSAQLAEAKADWVIESLENGLPKEALE